MDVHHPPIALSEVTFRHGRRVILDQLSLDVERGRSVAITGRTGSGKSTLLSCVLGLQKPQKGTVRIGGERVDRLSQSRLARLRRQKIGFVFQQGELLPELSAVENAVLPALFDRTPWDKAAGRAATLLEELGIVDPGTPAGALSGGERQRVALARALINSPDIVIADEPTGALDADTRDDVARLLFERPRIDDTSLLVVTHDESVASRADRVYTLSEGRLVERTPARVSL